MLVTWLEVSRGVRRPPNRHLDQFRIFRQFNIARRQIQSDSFADVCAGFLFGFTSSRTAGEFGAHSRVVTGLGIEFQNDSELHSNSIPSGGHSLRNCVVAQCDRAGVRASGM